jgi:TRAP-type transport system small permease protein
MYTPPLLYPRGDNVKVKVKETGKYLLDFVELYIPFVMFMVLFVVFILGIIFRYFFKPLTWTLELSLMCFIWVSLLGGLYAKRLNSHVKFTMVYDAVSPNVQRWMRIVGNILLVISFGISFVPSYKYIMFMEYKKSNVLKIPMNIVFLPFLFFLAFMTGRYVVDIYRDVKKLIRGGKK